MNKYYKSIKRFLASYKLTVEIYREINYLHATETSRFRSFSCIFGVVLLLVRKPCRQTNADLKMANETRVLIHAIMEAYLSCFVSASSLVRRLW